MGVLAKNNEKICLKKIIPKRKKVSKNGKNVGVGIKMSFIIRLINPYYSAPSKNQIFFLILNMFTIVST